MAFLGDFGKIFLGGASTGTVVGALTGNPAIAAGAQKAADLASKVTQAQGTQQGQAVAVSQATQTMPAETQSSGAGVGSGQFLGYSDMGGSGFESVYSGQPSGMQPSQAGLPAIAGGALSAGKGLYGLLFGGAIAAAPMIIDQFTGQPKKLRVTRKLQRDVKNAVMLLGIDTVASQLGVDPSVVVYIMTKKIRNDGQYVTKAAVRKTRQTVRKMRAMCDLYDDLRPAAKRAPARRRASTTKVTQIRN
ncbi:MAG: hypothetical protein VW972_06585 [Flavobacteriaceae bacterium]